MINSPSSTGGSIRTTGAAPALQRTSELGQRLWRFADAAFRAWGARRLAREMAHWPEERLRDVGLSRAEVAAAIAGLRRPYRWEPDCVAVKLDPSSFGH